MKKNTKIVAIIVVLIIISIGIGFYIHHKKTISSSIKQQTSENIVKNKNATKKSSAKIPHYDSAKSDKDALTTVKKLISVLYFKDGDYKEYKGLFTNPERALNETKFNEYRKDHSAKDKFPVDNETVDSIMKHMKAVKNDKNITVYYLKDINNEKEMQDALQWKLVEKGNKTVIRNDGVE